MFVYLITNTVNGKRYIGQTKQTLQKRWIMHVNKNHCRYLYNAIHKYGRENFLMEPLCEIPTRELANDFEIEYIKRYRTMFPNGYNIQPGGDDRPELTVEQKKAISERHKGNKYCLGKVTSEETKRKLSDINKGKVLTEEHKAKIAASHIGIGHTEESKRKMSLSRTGKVLSVEHVAKIAAANRGKKRSAETVQRMVDAWKKRKLSVGQS